MLKTAVIAHTPIISVKNEADKIDKALRHYGCKNGIWYIGSLFIPNLVFSNPPRLGTWNLLIYWTAFAPNAAWVFQFYDNHFLADRAVFYGVCEGKPDLPNAAYLRRDKVVVPSQFNADMLKEHYNIDVLAVIPHGIDFDNLQGDPQYMAAWRSKYRGKKIILYVGNAIIRKGLRQLFKAAEAIRPKLHRHNAIIVLHTRGDRYDYLGYSLYEEAAKVKDLVVIEEEFSPGTPLSTVYSKMAAADIIVQPSHSEGFGLPALEAMALKKPLVYVDAPAVNEFAVGHKVPVNGDITWWRYLNFANFKMYNYDPHDLADMLLYALENPHETSELVNKAYNRAAEYNIYKVYRRFIDLARRS